MNTDERDERLKQIRERRNALQLRHGDWPCQTVRNSRERAFQQYVLADIDFLLSLYDGYAMCRQVQKRGKHSSNTCACVVAVELFITNNAATRMRDLCVEKVRELRQQYDAAEKSLPVANGFTDKANAADEIITALQSITLEVAANSVAEDEGEGENL